MHFEVLFRYLCREWNDLRYILSFRGKREFKKLPRTLKLLKVALNATTALCILCSDKKKHLQVTRCFCKTTSRPKPFVCTTKVISRLKNKHEWKGIRESVFLTFPKQYLDVNNLYFNNKLIKGNISWSKRRN